MHPLQELIQLEQAARDFGFEWSDYAMILNQVRDECREIEDDLQSQAPPDKLQEEIGDLLHAALALCVFAGFDVEETIIKINQKFSGRLTAMRQLAHAQGLNDFHGLSMETMLTFWEQAKANKEAEND